MSIGILKHDPLRRFLEKLLPRGEVYYINGPQTLPPPLSQQEEAELIDRLAIDEGARNILVERNLRLVVYIAKKFESSAVGIEDLISIGTIGLMKAVNTFRPDRQIKLATYASRCIENEILMFLRKNAGVKAELSLDEPLNVDYDGNELLLGDMLGYLLEQYAGVLRRHEGDMFRTQVQCFDLVLQEQVQDPQFIRGMEILQRNPVFLVQQIVEAYEKYEKKEAYQEKRRQTYRLRRRS